MAEVLIIGAARSGKAAARLLKKHGHAVTLTDSLRSLPLHAYDGVTAAIL